MTRSDEVEKAANILREAEDNGLPCAPIRGLLPPQSLEAAYAVQRINVDTALGNGRRLAGWKIGLTNPAVQRQLGVDQPDSGALFADTEVGDDRPIPVDRVLQPKVEAEVAFVLRRNLDAAPVGAADVLLATEFVLPAIEVVGSRIANWDIDIVDTIADNASSGVYVLGPSPKKVTEVDLRQAAMRIVTDGREVSSGSGSACLGHPVNAVVWLANHQIRLGSPLRAGDVVLSGALGPMVSVEPGRTYEATIDGLGSVRANFSTGTAT